MNATQNDLVHNIMPKFQSRRIVRAATIDHRNGDELCILVGGAEYIVQAAPKMFERYAPAPGDYYLVYDDGYTSICPKASFEAGYVGGA